MKVLFTEYGNREEVPIAYLQLSTDDPAAGDGAKAGDLTVTASTCTDVASMIPLLTVCSST